jgi:hypothetical protein
MATAAVAKAVSAGPLDQWKPNTPKQAKTKAILQGAFVEAPKTNIVVANNRAADNTPLPGTTEVYTLKSRGYFGQRDTLLADLIFLADTALRFEGLCTVWHYVSSDS